MSLVYGTENNYDFSRLDTGTKEEELGSGISMSDIVVANRYPGNLPNLEGKLFSRDIFGEN